MRPQARQNSREMKVVRRNCHAGSHTVVASKGVGKALRAGPSRGSRQENCRSSGARLSLRWGVGPVLGVGEGLVVGVGLACKWSRAMDKRGV